MAAQTATTLRDGILALSMAALLTAIAGACKDIEPVGTDGGDADTTVSKTDTSADAGPTGMDGTAMDATAPTDGDTTRTAPEDADSGIRPEDTSNRDTREPSGPGACCTRNGCVYVDAEMDCTSPTYFPGFECSQVTCGSTDV